MQTKPLILLNKISGTYLVWSLKDFVDFSIPPRRTTMSIFNKSYALTFFVASLSTGAAWAASFPFPHRLHQAACPTAVENVGQTMGQTNAAAQDNKLGVAVDKKNRLDVGQGAKAQNGMLLPAVKTGKAPGQAAGEAGKADAAAAAK